MTLALGSGSWPLKCKHWPARRLALTFVSRALWRACRKSLHIAPFFASVIQIVPKKKRLHSVAVPPSEVFLITFRRYARALNRYV